MALPWIAYVVGWCIATLFKQKHEDRVAIAIEAGIQNTGIAIYILRTTLDQPQADLTTVVSEIFANKCFDTADLLLISSYNYNLVEFLLQIPVSVALMTPIPLLFYFIYLKGKDRYVSHKF